MTIKDIFVTPFVTPFIKYYLYICIKNIQMASIKILLRKDKLSKKNGKAPLFIRITQNRKSKFISLGISVEPKYWNEDKSMIKKGAENYQEINAYIIQKRAEIERTSLELNVKFNKITSSIIKEKIKGKRRVDFFDYCEKKLEDLKEVLTYSTYDVYRVRLGKLKKYYEGKELFIDEIDLEFLNEYEKYQFKTLKNKPYTVLNNFKFIKTMVNHAQKDNLIDHDLSFFKKSKIPTKQTGLKYLTEQQFQKVLHFDKSKIKKTYLFRFIVFSCYCGGLRISDVLNLKWINYIESEQSIVPIIKKTKRKHQIKLPEKANEIINTYKRDNLNQSDYIFPLLKYNPLEENISEKIKNSRIKTHNEKANKVLKEVSEELKLPFKLTFHSSRHTFATIALKRGMRIEYVSKILDHTHINTTQIYAKIINEELDKAMDIMNF